MASEKQEREKNLKQPGRYDGYIAIDHFQYYSYLNYIRPIPQEPSGYPIWYELFKLNSFCYCISAITGVGYTKEENKQIIFEHDERLNEVASKYGFRNFIEISHYCNISFSDWMNFSVYAKQALIYEFNEVMADIEKERNKSKMEEELKMKQTMQQNKAKPVGSSTSNLSIFK